MSQVLSSIDTLIKIQTVGFDKHPDVEIVEFGNSVTFSIPREGNKPYLVTVRGEEYFFLRHFLNGGSLEEIWLKSGFKHLYTFEVYCQLNIKFLNTLVLSGMYKLKSKPAFLNPPTSKLHSLIRRIVSNPFRIQFKAFNPDKLLTEMYKYFWWMFEPLTLVLMTCFIVYSLLSFFNNQFMLEKTSFDFQQFMQVKSWAWMMLILIACKIPHEFAHGLAMKHLGRKVHEMGLGILVVSPFLYCDATEIALEKSKWKKIMVAGAGAYMDLLIAAIAAMLFLYTDGSSSFANTMRLVVLANLGWTMTVNLIPFTRFDGHYILAYLWGRPNLGLESKNYVSCWIRGIFFDPDFDVRNRDYKKPDVLWLGLFGVASMIYRGLLVFSISTYFYYLGASWYIGFITGPFALFVMLGANHYLLSAWDEAEKELSDDALWNMFVMEFMYYTVKIAAAFALSGAMILLLSSISELLAYILGYATLFFIIYKIGFTPKMLEKEEAALLSA